MGPQINIYFYNMSYLLNNFCNISRNASKTLHPPGEPIIVFRSDKALSNDEDETYKGSLINYDELNVWTQEKCVPLVREVTFENAEELTEEGLPFLILFHAPDDVESVKLYKDIISKTLINEKRTSCYILCLLDYYVLLFSFSFCSFSLSCFLVKYLSTILFLENVNFLTADGLKFVHPLHHLGKTPADLPVIAIDSLRHMYLFKDFNDIHKEGKLKSFLQDLYSGKLHREFHYGPEISKQEDVLEVTEKQVKTPTTPPESTFKKLAPSKNRYTLLRDEL